MEAPGARPPHGSNGTSWRRPGRRHLMEVASLERHTHGAGEQLTARCQLAGDVCSGRAAAVAAGNASRVTLATVSRRPRATQGLASRDRHRRCAWAEG